MMTDLIDRAMQGLHIIFEQTIQAQWTHMLMIALSSRQKAAAPSFWRNDNFVITSVVITFVITNVVSIHENSFWGFAIHLLTYFTDNFTS